MKTMPATTGHGPRSRQDGSALVVAIVAVSVLAVLAGAGLTFNVASTNAVRASGDTVKALYMAEAGVSEALTTMRTSLVTGDDIPEELGSSAAPMERKNGEWWATIALNADDTFTVRSVGQTGTNRRALEVIVDQSTGSVFDYALYAGNSGGDPNYALRLGGSGSQADEVVGNLYSAGDILIEGDATVSGDLTAGGSIDGGDGESGATLPLPDIVGMDYENEHDFDVAAMFDADRFWASDAAGGSAWQMSEASPAHIFRMNPSDRTSETSGTEKNDYFLEDPYESVHVDSSENGSDAYHITLSGTGGESGPSGTDKLYYIDGNLWLHNKNSMSLMLDGGNDGARVTFVVKGNVYFSDNLFLYDTNTDGVAFIAIQDPDVEDSGNVYFGDPSFGTLKEMYAFMYAENNFYDYNLDASGSATVAVHGNMSASNQVSIDRDYTTGYGRHRTTQHSKLTVDFDPRISSGALALPGIPTWGGEAGFSVVSWREIAVP